MNAKVFLTFDRCGLLRDTYVEGTSEPLVDFADTTGRFNYPGTFTVARIVPKLQNFSKAAYLTKDEKADLEFFHAVRYANQNARSGKASAHDKKVSHVWHNLLAWLKARDFHADVAAVLLGGPQGGAGWWRRGISGAKDLSELAALIRTLHRNVTAGESNESPYVDCDNGQLEYAG